MPRFIAFRLAFASISLLTFAARADDAPKLPSAATPKRRLPSNCCVPQDRASLDFSSHGMKNPG